MAVGHCALNLAVLIVVTQRWWDIVDVRRQDVGSVKTLVPSHTHTA